MYMRDFAGDFFAAVFLTAFFAGAFLTAFFTAFFIVAKVLPLIVEFGTHAMFTLDIANRQESTLVHMLHFLKFSLQQPDINRCS